jgi:hypothetical protein
VFFENTACVSCGHLLAFLPDLMLVGSLDPSGDDQQQWVSPLARAGTYRLCANYSGSQICNWAVDIGDPHQLCESCRLTAVIPDLAVDGNRQAWYRLEAAKRRLLYTLRSLRLGVDASGLREALSFRFLGDAAAGEPPVLTGHASGVITINVAEADDAERERRRHALGEPYRTLLGHMRHEVGHYYWMRLVEDDSVRLDRFRSLFGDEREDYGAALKRHYDEGPAPAWQDVFVTSYASAHPWEDWAETWAHYLHMVDTLETAATCGVSLRPRRRDEPALGRVAAEAIAAEGSFDRLMESWFPLTYMLNNLNRGLGLADAYPFVLSAPAIEKLRFVHETITAAPST